jgi:hypothetical protein
MSRFRERALEVLAALAEDEAVDDELRLQAASAVLYDPPPEPTALCMVCRGVGISKTVADAPCSVCGGAGKLKIREPQPS